MFLAPALLLAESSCTSIDCATSSCGRDLMGQCMQTTQETLLASPLTGRKRFWLVTQDGSQYVHYHPESVVERLPRGTRFEVVDISQENLDMFARCWRVQVKLLDSVRRGVVADIPACDTVALPTWLNTTVTRLEPGDRLMIRPEFAGLCN